jgi:23S rRNA (guanosine2251-2'-O)-methyltransferase
VRAVEYLKESGIRVFAASEKSDTGLPAQNFTGPVAIVMGAEDRGVSREVLELTDETISIPITGNTASLNVSVAAGILLYEVTRQRSRTS